MRAIIQAIYQRLNFRFVIGLIIGIVPVILFAIGQAMLFIAVRTSSEEHPSIFLAFYGLALWILVVIQYLILFPAILIMLFFPKLRMISYGVAVPLLLVPIASLYFFGEMGVWCVIPLAIVFLCAITRLLLGLRRQRATQISASFRPNEGLDPQL